MKRDRQAVREGGEVARHCPICCRLPSPSPVSSLPIPASGDGPGRAEETACPVQRQQRKCCSAICVSCSTAADKVVRHAPLGPSAAPRPALLPRTRTGPPEFGMRVPLPSPASPLFRESGAAGCGHHGWVTKAASGPGPGPESVGPPRQTREAGVTPPGRHCSHCESGRLDQTTFYGRRPPISERAPPLNGPLTSRLSGPRRPAVSE